MAEFGFKIPERTDVKEIISLIMQFASYEKLADQVVCDEKEMIHWIFEEKKVEVLLLQEDGKNIGYTFFFSNYSTFVGKPGIYLEDLFILPEYRGKGYGKKTLEKLASIAVERGYGRFEWTCLDWNEPAIKFYKGLGAKPLEDWTIYRVDGDTLKEMGSKA